MMAIQVEQLTRRYGDVVAVDEIDFTVPVGPTFGLLGGNGAGKTTTIAMLLALLIPTSGRVTILEHDMATDRFAALARMNFSSPYVSLPSRLTVMENMRVYGHLYNVSRLEERISSLARDLGLGAILQRPAGQLSAGQKTRVALAKALINRPEVLPLDEPTANLDPDTGDMFALGCNGIARKAVAPSCWPAQHGGGGTYLLSRGVAEEGAHRRSRQPTRFAGAI